MRRRTPSPGVRLARTVGLVAGVALLVLPLTGSNAATPGSGTVSGSNTSVTWAGANETPTAAPCTGPDDPACDTFKLTIDPPAYGFTVTVKLQPLGDWDLYVYAPDGGLANSSGNAPFQTEVVVLTNPSAGTWTVAAAPFAPAPGAGPAPSYTASATLTPLDTNAPPSTGSERLTYASHHAPTGMGSSAGEPSVGADWESGKAMYQAGTETLRATFDDSVSPANATWEDVSFPTTAANTLDPIGWMDHPTERWMTSELSGTTSVAAITDDAGTTWIPSEGGPGNGGVDHQTVGSGPYHEPLTRDPGGALYPNAWYYCSQDLVAALCARSDDGGLTFAPAVPIYTDQCGGLHGHVKVGPDGTVYVPNKSCGGRQGVVVSEDNGVTWSVRTVPLSSPGDWDPAVAIGPDNTVYFAYDDGDGHAKVAVSHDHGVSWTNVQDVGAPFGVAHSAFPVAVAGDNGRAAVAFLGTDYAGAGAFGDNQSWPGVWYLYVSETFDGGSTWSTVNATPNDPVQRGTICAGGFLGCGNGTRNLLDFNGVDVDRQGRVLVAYADGCVGACIAAPPGSFTAVATIARQVSGKRLFAAGDQVGPPAAPSLYAKATATSPPQTILSWQEPDDHGSAITSYRIYRNGSLLATVGGDARGYTDTTTESGVSYSYALSAVNAAGEGPKSPAVTPVVEAPPQDPCVEPGATVLTDASGDSATTAGTDLMSFWLSQSPAAGGNIKLRFQLNTDPGVDPQAPGSYWYVSFKAPDGTVHGVRMWYAPTAPTAPTFQSYIAAPNTSGGVDGRFVQNGSQKPADASSFYDAAGGRIVIVVSSSDLGLKAGDQITGFNAASVQSVSTPTGGGAAATVDEMPDGLGYDGSFTVSDCHVAQPDLAITGSDIAVVQQDTQSGKLVTILATVHNAGDADASSVSVRFSVDGTQIAQATIPTIGAGSLGRASTQWSTKGQKGDHTVTVTADPANAIAESNEANNTAAKTVTIKGGTVR
jgi:hypothetical protein